MGHDIIVLGGGPAGLAAAVAARGRGKTVLVIGNPWQDSPLARAERVDNYLGLPGQTGAELVGIFRAHAEELGTDFVTGRAISLMAWNGFMVTVGSQVYDGQALILAPGVVRQAKYPGEAEFLGRGVSYCATCDGMLYRGKTVALIGNSREAKEDADFLADIGCRVLRFEENGRYEISGGLKADTLKFRGQEYKVDCVFIIKDTVSVTRLVPGLNYEKGGIVTDRHMATNLPGVFAAGDCTGKPYQLPKAVGEGNIAALSACEYLDSAK